MHKQSRPNSPSTTHCDQSISIFLISFFSMMPSDTSFGVMTSMTCTLMSDCPNQGHLKDLSMVDSYSLCCSHKTQSKESSLLVNQKNPAHQVLGTTTKQRNDGEQNMRMKKGRKRGKKKNEWKQQETEAAQSSDAGHSSHRKVQMGGYYSQFMLICWESSMSSISVGM